MARSRPRQGRSRGQPRQRPRRRCPSASGDANPHFGYRRVPPGLKQNVVRLHDERETEGAPMEAAGLSEARRETLRAFCDTIVPSVPRPDDPDGFWARKASDLAIDQGVEQVLMTVPPELQAGLGQLLDVLAQQSFAQGSQLSREQVLVNMTIAAPDAAQGIAA